MVALNAVLNLPDLTPGQAEHWVVALLAQERALRQYDSHLFPLDAESDALRIAEELHEAWRRWADEGRSILNRVAVELPLGTHIAGAHDLDYGVARAGAMLKLSPRTIQHRIKQVADGQVLRSEEVRDAVRLADRG